MFEPGTIYAMAADILLARIQRFAAASEHVLSLTADLRAAAAALPAPAMGEFRNSWGGRRKSIYSTDNGVATIAVRGEITRGPDWMLDWDGEPYTMQAEIIDAAQQAQQDPNVRSVLLTIDSPGGAAMGLIDTAGALEQLGTSKRVVAHTPGMMASGGLYLGMSAHQVFATADAMVGSIGTVMSLTDISGMLAARGIKVEIIRSAPLKYAGSGLEPLTSDQREHFQGNIDAIAAQFKAHVARGRGMTTEAVDAAATGASYLAPKALAMGLIDGIASGSQVATRMRGTAAGALLSKNISGAEVSTMANEKTTAAPAETITPAKERADEKQVATASTPTVATLAELKTSLPASTPTVATLAELKTSLPGSTAEFRESCIERNFTLPQAQAEWTATLAAENKQLKTKLAEGQKSQAVRANAPGEAAEAVAAGVAESAATPKDRDEAWMAQWKASPKLKEAFLEGEDYVAFMRRNPSTKF